MTRWTDRQVRLALGLPDPGAEGPAYAAVGTDSRTLPAGSLFVALVGERFDGHQFLAQARSRGATGAVVRKGTAAVPGLTLYAVDDTLEAYGRLARHRRRGIAGPVVAITGTNGKTSTKELLAVALRTRYRTHATRLNLNNLVGVPQTILEAPADVEALVVEAGANQPGEIARYRAIIEPSHGVITNVAAGHLEGFGSLAGVMTEKLELIRDVPLAVVGTDPPALAERARGLARRVITAGLAGADVVPDGVEVAPDGRPTVSVDGHRFTLSLHGRHQAGNAMLAWALARELALPPDAVAGALARCVIPGGRGELLDVGGLTILNDCYNANPASFRAAIELARALRGSRPLAFVAGSMLELGPDADRLHREIAAELAGLGAETLAGVGAFVAPLEALRPRVAGRLLLGPDAETIAAPLAEALRGDELVVLKASRGVALERIVPRLTARFHPTAESA